MTRNAEKLSAGSGRDIEATLASCLTWLRTLWSGSCANARVTVVRAPCKTNWGKLRERRRTQLTGDSSPLTTF